MSLDSISPTQTAPSEDASSDVALAIVVGGSAVRSAVVSSSDAIVAGVRSGPIDAMADADTIFDALADVIAEEMRRAGKRRVRGVGIGMPGPFDYREGTAWMESQGKFSHLYGFDVGTAVAKRVGIARHLIRFTNDAEAAIIGEWIARRPAPWRRVAGLTLGTGLGAAFIENGRVIRQVPAPAGGELWDKLFMGRRADDVFSSRGISARFATAGFPSIDARGANALARTETSGRAVELWRTYGDELGKFVTPHLRAFDAEALLVLGGIAQAFDLFGPALAKASPVPVHVGGLESSALIGAAQVVWRT